MTAQKSLISMTKMMICGNWLHLTWMYFHKGIQNCFETGPITLNIWSSWVECIISIYEARFADLPTTDVCQRNVHPMLHNHRIHVICRIQNVKNMNAKQTVKSNMIGWPKSADYQHHNDRVRGLTNYRIDQA